MQQSAEDGGNASPAISYAHEKTPVFPGSASDCGTLQPVLMGDEGLETNACSPGETSGSESGGTPGGTMAGDRLKTLTELLANVASLSNEDLTKILNAAHRVERQ